MPPNLMKLGSLARSTAASPSGLTLMRKLPDEPWKLINVLFDGLDARNQKDRAEAEMHMLQSLVGGWYQRVISTPLPTPYSIVCNEEGRPLGLPPCVYSRRFTLVGPVLLVRNNSRNSGLTSMSVKKGPSSEMDLIAHFHGVSTAMTPHLVAIVRLLGKEGLEDGVEGRRFDLRLTAPSMVAEAVHA